MASQRSVADMLASKSVAQSFRDNLADLDDAELLEDAAIKLIQHAYKCHRFRQSFRQLLRLNYVRVFNPELDQYVFKNKVTGNVFITKPSFITNEDDLPIHRTFVAPTDYRPNTRDPIEGYALLVTVQDFINAKIPNLPDILLSDHKKLHDILSHDFYCRISPENIVSLIDPKCSDLNSAFDVLRRKIGSNANVFVLVYMCTHVITAPNADKTNKDASTREPNCYLLMKDSSWKSAQAVSASSVSLLALTGLVNSLPTAHKTLVLHYAHLPRPRLSMFGNTKLMYPPEDVITRLCQATGAAVMASCSVGTPLRHLLPFLSPVVLDPPRALEPYPKVPSDAAKVSFESNEKKDRSAELVSHYRHEWRIPEDLPMLGHDAPAKPVEQWSKNRVTGEIKVQLPRPEQVNSCVNTLLQLSD